MKRLTALIVCFIMLISLSAEATLLLEYNGGVHEYNGSLYKLKVNGKYIKTPLEPIIMNERAMVPVREVFEAMGAEVGYRADTQEITVSMDNAYVMLRIGSNVVFVNGTRKNIPDGVVPMLIAKKGESAKTMVPARFVSESINMNVVFDGNKGEIKINNPAVDFEEEDAPVTNVYTSAITSIKIKKMEDSISVIATLDKRPENVSNAVYVAASGVVYVDVAGARYTTDNIINTDESLVKSVRLGIHEGYSRIAVDTSGIKSYNRTLSKDGKTLTINIGGDNTNFTDEPISTPTPTPGSSTPPITNLPQDKPFQPTPTPAPTPTPEAHLTGEKIVVIDAGHGGKDAGTSYTHDEITYTEKVINLEVAKKVTEILRNNGVRTEMTRTGDTYPTLTDRSDFANKLGASMFVSIHSNAVEENNEANGIEVYYSETNNSDRYGITSKELATDVYKNMIKNTSAGKRGVKTAQHVVTRTSEMPAILVELGFVTNKTEAENLADDGYQDLLASAIAAGILSNLNSITIPPKPIEKVITQQTEGEISTNEN